MTTVMRILAGTALGSFQLAAVGTMAAAQVPSRPDAIRLLGNWGGMVGGWICGSSAAILVLSEAGVWVVRSLSGAHRLGWILSILTNLCRIACILTWLRTVRNSQAPAEKAVKAFIAKVKRTDDTEATTAPTPALASFIADTVVPVSIPWNVTTIKDISYVSQAELEQCGGEKAKKFLQLDVIRKQTGYKGRPILMYIHGGAWKFSDKADPVASLGHLVSEENWIVININYRLIPAANLLDIICDCKKALRWIKQNPQIHGGDTSFIAVVGGSAGGHLTAMMALTQNDPAFQKGWEHVDTSIQAAISLYGVMEPLGPISLDPTNDGMNAYTRREVVRMTDEESQALTGRPVMQWVDPVAVLKAMSLEARKQMPPIFLIHGSADTLVFVDHSRTFFEELKRGNAVITEFLEFPGVHHAFDLFHGPATVYATWAMGCVLDAVYSERDSLKKKT
ncbi:Alpha/Beta hydrolase protein [Zopfochytrium polystomum]|nr:Alpha/Beta hydrolase protein [Zopfochytrium polystomum]